MIFTRASARDGAPVNPGDNDNDSNSREGMKVSYDDEVKLPVTAIFDRARPTRNRNSGRGSKYTRSAWLIHGASL